MPPSDDKKLRAVYDYHARTKHQPERYAVSLGYMDWANQPNPFRTYAGSEQIDLPHPEPRAAPSYDALFAGCPPTARLGPELVGRLFLHSLGLSAWKQAPGMSPWPLRINPSSGNLHPTESYLITGAIPGLIAAPGVLHYAPFRHQLEHRCQLTGRQWASLAEGMPDACLLIALTSIYWRESWKYGERAFRYCNHDVGHAIAAIALSARTLGWETALVTGLADEDLGRLVGIHLQSGVEAEHADCLLALWPADGKHRENRIPELSPAQWQARLPSVRFVGEPNVLSREHHAWPAIDEVARAVQRSAADTPCQPRSAQQAEPMRGALLADRRQPAEQIICQRRSAVNMDGATSLDRGILYHMLQRVLPGQFPLNVLPGTPRIALAIFVHRVDDLAPGLYLLVRDPPHAAGLRTSLTRGFEWQRPDGCPEDLLLYRLQGGDVRSVAKQISCHQDIAADGVFSLGMLSDFDAALATDGPERYPQLFWETGLIGQVLYLEAEAAGMRGTGIGCFFDDSMHTLLGIEDRSWQSLYHFTIGGPVEDTRLKTIAPYAHIPSTGS